MRMTLSLPEDLVRQVQRLLKEKKVSPAVRRALEEYVRQIHWQRLVRLAGTIDIEDVSAEMERLELEEHSSRHIRRR